MGDGGDTGEPPFPERFDPATMGGELVEAEHLCRYLWVAALAEGARVLDAGCGTGYGTAILAGAGARSVVGVDRAEPALAAARAAHPGLRYERGDLAALPVPDDAVDLAVCFEAIEHVDDQPAVLDELVRVLAPGGVLAISSPNRDTYVPGNPFHTHEYLPEELREALAARLAHVRLLRQRNYLASAVMEDAQFAAADRSPFGAMRLRPLSGYAPGREIFTVALASDGLLPSPDALTVLTHVDELRRWVEWNQHVEGVLRDAEAQLAVIPLAEAARVAAEGERDVARAEVAAAAALLDELSRSRSWRLTAPLRAGAAALGTARARRGSR